MRRLLQAVSEGYKTSNTPIDIQGAFPARIQTLLGSVSVAEALEFAEPRVRVWFEQAANYAAHNQPPAVLLDRALGRCHSSPPAPASSPIACWDVLYKPAAHVAVFALPSGSCIPLHDHPGMSVFSKLLQGSLQVHSADSGGSCQLQQSSHSSGDMWHLTPNSGNLHAFVNLGHDSEPCVVLEVLTPPYSAQGPCTYYAMDAEGGGGGLRKLPSHPSFLNMVNLTRT